MEEMRNLLSEMIDSNIIYIIACVVLAVIGIRITKKVITFALTAIALGYTLFKFATSSNLIS